MARDVQKALVRLEQALEEEEVCDEEEYDEESDVEEYADEEDTYEEEYVPPEKNGVRYGFLKVLAMLLMTGIAVMLLIIAMKIKGMIP